jgi:hypothetical protein
VNRAPPELIKGSASFAIRMNDQHEDLNRAENPLRAIDDTPLQIRFGRECD